MENFHIAAHSRSMPDKLAFKCVPSGATATYGELDAASNKVAHMLRKNGVSRGDCVAILSENRPEYFELVWGADRAGVYYTGVSTHLVAAEIAYIVRDSGAKLLFVSLAMAAVATEALRECPDCVGILINGSYAGLTEYRALIAVETSTPIEDESRGAPMLYSSGTTGRPKGVKAPLPDLAVGELDALTTLCRSHFQFRQAMVYLSPAPLYHAAPLRFSISAQRLGATVIVLEKFDPELALSVIAQERVTHSQWVPTHFVRMLKMDEEKRLACDLSSLEFAFHAAAPCPVPIKAEMIKWWGPIIHEYYAGTELNGMTYVSPQEWIARPGTVGRAIFGTLHILGEDGESELSDRIEGQIFFEGGTPFAYHNDPAKTASAYNRKGWSSLGDIGWLDDEGYLFLTDRKSFMIISGGVNIYPQEIENAIIAHSKVVDAAVVGAPDADLGERLVAVVQPVSWNDAGPALADEIRQSLSGNIARLKIPKQIDFMEQLPRLPTGKLYKRALRDRYWSDPNPHRVQG